MEQECQSTLIPLLLIEDHPIIRRGHRRRLTRLGYQVTTAATGEAAQAALLPRLPGGLPDFKLVVSDLGLPDMDGIDLCRWIRRYYSKAILPIVVVTAFGEEKRQVALDAGAQAYLMKPILYGGFLILDEYCSRNGNKINGTQIRTSPKGST